ncbi:MAG TPA: hypothetical protein VHU89_13910 [Acidobacteriaceae bacterium]|nr:hypothetical protein [Acidobacteriaceae bacterium]
MPRFCTAIHGRRRCPIRALPGQLFCTGHHPHPLLPRPCAYQTQSGAPCRSHALRGQDNCFTHSRHNHRATQRPVPLIPRTRRRNSPDAQDSLDAQNSLDKWLASINLPHAKTALREL